MAKKIELAMTQEQIREKNVNALEELERKRKEEQKRISDKADEILTLLKGFSVLEVGAVFNDAQQKMIKTVRL